MLSRMNRRDFVITASLAAASTALPKFAFADDSELAPIWAEIDRRHDESLQRIQTWIRQPSIAAENRGMNEGCELMMQMLREVGFQQVTRMPTDGQPGVFATLDAGAPRTVALYFMYDVKQVDPSEWSSPPFEARLVDKPGFGKVVMGRGAVNQKGPEGTFLAALHAIRGAGKKLPVNLVFVAEGEEEIASPHFHQVIRRPEVLAALKKSIGVFMPFASQDPDGTVTINLGAKGVVELELISSGEKWGRGPKKDVHSSLKAAVDSPAWHLIEALQTLVTPDGNKPAIPGYTKNVRPLSGTEKQMIAEFARRSSEATRLKGLGVEHWIGNVDFQKSLEMLAGDPTINIEGLVGGYTGPGGKTILPHRAVAKIDMRLVPDMTATEALAMLKQHLADKGFPDIEVKLGGGYDPTTTPRESAIIDSSFNVFRKAGIDPLLFPRLAGSWPGYLFTGDPLHLPAGHFGMGHGSGAHAPDEYYVIESTNKNVEGLEGATRSYVNYLYDLATVKLGPNGV